MIKFVSFVLILTLLALFLIYKNYQSKRDFYSLLRYIIFLVFIITATLFSRYLLVNYFLLILHILALAAAWINLFALLINKTKKIFLIFLPLLTIGLFFISGFFVSWID